MLTAILIDGAEPFRLFGRGHCEEHPYEMVKEMSFKDICYQPLWRPHMFKQMDKKINWHNFTPKLLFLKCFLCLLLFCLRACMCVCVRACV